MKRICYLATHLAVTFLIVLCFSFEAEAENMCTRSESRKMKNDGEMSSSQIKRICLKGRCSDDEMFEMSLSDISDDRIDEICRSSYDDNRSRYDDRYRSDRYRERPVGTVCMTQSGTCYMAVPVYVGDSCHCRTAYGPIPGVVR